MPSDGTPLIDYVVSFAVALIGLAIAVLAVIADNTWLLVAGVAIGTLAPALIRLGVTGRPRQAGWPYTATTTDRSKLFADQTPIAVLAQSDMIAK